jgi:hypothetical protein
MLLILMALLAAGCSASAGTPIPEEQERESFSSRRESADGAVVYWSGYVEGFEPAMEAGFDVAITNETGQAWSGRYCLQLMSNDQPLVLATLEQRPFELEPGVGFSDTLTVQFPEPLDDGAYGLSLVVRKPGDPMVDMVPILVGEADLEHRGTQEDMDAALEACPPVAEDRGEAEPLVELAKEDLAQRLGVGLDEVAVESVEAVEFPDASLGVPEPDKAYAQVITPGYVIRLTAEGETYEYHGADGRVVLAVEGL